MSIGRNASATHRVASESCGRKKCAHRAHSDVDSGSRLIGIIAPSRKGLGETGAFNPGEFEPPSVGRGGWAAGFESLQDVRRMESSKRSKAHLPTTSSWRCNGIRSVRLKMTSLARYLSRAGSRGATRRDHEILSGRRPSGIDLQKLASSNVAVAHLFGLTRTSSVGRFFLQQDDAMRDGRIVCSHAFGCFGFQADTICRNPE